MERLDEPLRARLAAATEAWDREGVVERLWARDATVWTDADEANWLGWLDAPRRAPLTALAALSRELAEEDLSDVLLIGMGGSSLAPEVLSLVLGPDDEPRLRVLDSTDPAQIRRTLEQVDLARTLCIVSSKSGTTLESATLADCLVDRLETAVGVGQAPRRCLAITDPGSALEERARAAGFRSTWHGEPTIGGRFSALSNFGLVPAAAIGLDVAALVSRADAMGRVCGPETALEENPGVRLGLALGVAAQAARDKVTLVLSPSIAPLGWWLEQLLAESTGKGGQGIIPVVDEPLGTAADYGSDRLFVYLRLEEDADPAQDEAIARLAGSGHPVVELRVPDRQAVAAEFFRWEIATAVCGAVLGVNPFDQPDVEASKVATRALTAAYESSGTLPGQTPLVQEEELSLLVPTAYAERLGVGGGGVDAEQVLRAHLGALGAGDYFALLLYLDMSERHVAAATRLRELVRDARGAATSVGFGPRFLHSTGQVFKGGPPSGVFLQVTGEDEDDVSIPGRSYSFGVVKAAQARGDFQVLAERGRRVLGVHLGKDHSAGLDTLERLVRAALGH